MIDIKSKKIVIVLMILFFIILFLFVIFANKISFSDVAQHLNVAKEFAGIAHSKVRNTPGWIYGWFLGQFLKIIPSLQLVKLLNALWLFLDGILLYFITKNKKTFLLWMFSPIVWYMGVWINPILACSFFLLIAYYSIKRYEDYKNKKYFILSALSLGLIPAIWSGGFYISVFFLCAFFYNKKLIKLILYLIPFFITFSFRLIFDAYYFNFPFFSIIRGIGSNLVYLSGNALSQISSTGEGLPYIYRLILLFLIISPFLFRLYKLNFKKHIPEYVFLGFTSILFLMNLQLRYFIVIAPILILLLSDLIKKKEFFIHIVIS
jgi:hypothetical protein